MNSISTASNAASTAARSNENASSTQSAFSPAKSQNGLLDNPVIAEALQAAGLSVSNQPSPQDDIELVGNGQEWFLDDMTDEADNNVTLNGNHNGVDLGAGDDVISIHGIGNQVFGGEGDDDFFVSEDSDDNFIVGGPGNDTLHLIGGPEDYTVTRNEHGDLVYTHKETGNKTTIRGVENINFQR